MLCLCRLHNYLRLTWQEMLLIVSKQAECLAWCESGERGRESQAVALHAAFSLCQAARVLVDMGVGSPGRWPL